MPVAMAKTLGLEDDLVRRQPHLLGQQSVGAATDFDLALDRVRLALLVVGHDDDRSPVSASRAARVRNSASPSLSEIEFTIGLPPMQRQPRLDDGPLRRVDDDRHAGNGRLGSDQIQEMGHRGFRVEQGPHPC